MKNKSATSTQNLETNDNGYPEVNVDVHTEKCATVSSGSHKPEQKPLVKMDHIWTPQQTCWQRVFSWRSFIVLLLHFINLINMIPRVTISIALVCMCGPVQAPRNHTHANNETVANIASYTDFNNMEKRTLPQEQKYEFNWDPEIRGLLTSAHAFGVFLVPQMSNVIRGYLGNKLTLTLFTLALAVIHFLTPIAARTSVYIMLALRILTSLTTTAQIPIVADTIAWWIPVQEKLTSASFVVSGLTASGVVFPVVSGYLCSLPVDNGWPLAFYFQGSLFVLGAVIWYFLSSRKPDNHPFISQQEKDYIIAHRVGMNVDNTKAAERPPYGTILTSRPVVGYIIAQSLFVWGVTVILTCLPLYLTSVLKFSVQEASVVFAVMSGLCLLSLFLWSVLGNWLAGMTCMTTNKVRKVCCFLGHTLSGVLYFATSFFDEQEKWAAVALIIGSAMAMTFGAIMVGVIPLDLAPRYAGFISALTSTCTSVVAISSPIVATAITGQGLYEEWRVVWLALAGVNVSSAVIFLVFGDASIQPWALATKDITLSNDNEESPLHNK